MSAHKGEQTLDASAHICLFSLFIAQWPKIMRLMDHLAHDFQGTPNVDTFHHVSCLDEF